MNEPSMRYGAVASGIEQTRGRIFDIQRFSIHDGPGIRTLVFFKGCRLRCRWCSNPESQAYEVETLTLHGKPKTVGRDVTVGEVMETVLRDLPYYRRSGGGVTLSGGEPLLQPEFAASLLQSCHKHNLHTAVETAAYVPAENIAQVLPHLDLVLLDIKHMDPDKHKTHVGQSNATTLANAALFAKGAKELIIRVPVVPGFNDTEREIADIAAFARSLPGVRRLHLLPYHRLGQDKYEGLGRPYPLDGVLPPTASQMNKLLAAAEASGLLCQIGG
ncbi:MAG: glycyl-radical enzyme activating protein [Eubacteriales bacterium]